MKLKYHQKSLELARSHPEFNDEAYPDLPASVAEWYSLMNGLYLLKKYSNEDVPVHPSEFETIRHEDKELLVFLYENQGVYWWAFEKCDNNDPPVYINVDPPPDRWVLCCNKFSDFVYSRLFDFYHWCDENLLTWASGKPIEQDVLDFLSSEYDSNPITRSGYSDTQYRFSRDDQKILIHDNGSSSGWYLSADSASELRNLLDKLKLKGMIEGHFPKIIGG